ncbi:translation initiation factor IF-2-like isoform X1 [Corvus kubaryi]|uniref:translation initiation factor IF-2-like isoform X1 n=1 Tax=Corvus kubaryi TaxID=68294 RepID=UPI001C059D1C|nr:translation initiation factor IF-2-like isoform X1 [Corvus kubaryi]
MWRPEPQAGSGSPGCPDLLQHVQALRSPPSPLYLSFFEEECRAIAARLRLGSAAEPSPGPREVSALQPEPAGPVTSTPLSVPSHGRVLDLSAGDCEAAAAPSPGPARKQPGCLPQPTANGGPGGCPARPPVQSRRARRGAGQAFGGRPGSPGRTPGRGRSRLALPRARASLGLQLPAAGTGRGAWETRLLQPPGTRPKLTSPARTRLQHASGASQQAQPSKLPTPAPRDREMKTAVKAGSRKQPSSRLSTAIATVASRSLPRPPGKVVSSKRFCLSKGSTMQELVCNRTQELKENGESKEGLVAAGTVLGTGKTDQTWVCAESSLSRELAPGLTSGCEDAVPAEQSAGDQLSQELEHVKKELERVKGELADKTAQCEAYQQTISSLQAQLRAAGMFPHCGEPSPLSRLQGGSSDPLLL